MKLFRDRTPKIYEFGFGIHSPTKVKLGKNTYIYNWQFYIMFGNYTFTLALNNKLIES